MAPLNIGIAGAGIGGLAAAAFLAREGHRVTVFDQFETAGPIGSGLILQETGLTILGELGLRTKAETLGAPIRRLYGRSRPSGRTVLDVRYGALRPGLLGVAIQRPALFTIVHDAALGAGARLVPSTRITAANPKDATLVDAAGALHGPFDFIVDALGVKSVLSSAPMKELPYGALWATLPWPAHSGFHADALEQRYEAASRMAGVMPSGRAAGDAPQTLTYFWSIRADRHDAWRAAPLTHWRDAALSLWPETEPLLTPLKTHAALTFARYRHRTHWPAVSGRMVHLGDSWHAASPQLGQGANMALLDAFALARAVGRKPNVGYALEDYARMRAGHVRLFQLMSYLFTPVYQSDSAVLPWLRDWLAAPVSRIWPGPQVLAAMVSGGLGAPLWKLGLKAAR
ncbi:FAD-dependent oxidoreductase [Hyphomonas johnsonii]|uniref:FAD-dependent oxidoreductase n=1 Tax=Hyphomonas johnsonii MHS-2 TaxID=1280950 RepID=A0A059FNZ9_9PROT|nr:NAD(P)/FAD-dependent oxidoreductase [Hyphomonas johnsonii]KCZ92395.1 FAD-dependent oxidoreductase [Hyphomonas johnsonii MHS-2]